MSVSNLPPNKAELILIGARELPRRLTVELSAGNFLTAAVFVENTYVSQASQSLAECFAIAHAQPAHHRALYIGCASFALSRSEWMELTNLLRPMGLRVEERQS